MVFSTRSIALILSASVCIFPAAAATISVQIVETGILADLASLEASSAWESGALDAIFDSGSIACNAPILRLESNTQMKGNFPKENTLGVRDARNGGADYLLLFVLVYDEAQASSNKSRARIAPKRVAARLLKLLPLSIVYEEERALVPSLSGKDDEIFAKEFTRKILSRVKER
ncbi:hypothetical protein MASR2M78_31710 [Treponema sp.]